MAFASRNVAGRTVMVVVLDMSEFQLEAKNMESDCRRKKAPYLPMESWGKLATCLQSPAVC
jgi:hypothetical protein